MGSTALDHNITQGDADLEFSQGHWDSAETYPGVAILGFPHKNLLTRGN